MKRILVVFGFICSLGLSANCQEFKRPVYQPRTLNAFTLYIVAGTTYTSANYCVGTTSFTINCSGVTSATTAYTLTAYTVDTLVAALNSCKSLVLGGDGLIYATKVQGCYGNDTAARLKNVAGNTIRNAAGTKTVTQYDTNGISYILTAPYNTAVQHRLGDFVANATFASGSCNINVYESTASVSSAQVRKETITISGSDAFMNTSDWFNESPTKTWRFDVVCSTNISDGYIDMSYYDDVSR